MEGRQSIVHAQGRLDTVFSNVGEDGDSRHARGPNISGSSGLKPSSHVARLGPAGIIRVVDLVLLISFESSCQRSASNTVEVRSYRTDILRWRAGDVSTR